MGFRELRAHRVCSVRVFEIRLFWVILVVRSIAWAHIDCFRIGPKVFRCIIMGLGFCIWAARVKGLGLRGLIRHYLNHQIQSKLNNRQNAKQAIILPTSGPKHLNPKPLNPQPLQPEP